MSDRKSYSSLTPNRADVTIDVVKKARDRAELQPSKKDEPEHQYLPETDDAFVSTLNFLFYDGASGPDPDNPDVYVRNSDWDDQEGLLLDSSISLDGWVYSTPRDIHFIQNKHFRDLDSETQLQFIKDQWEGATPETVSTALDRKALELISEQSYINNEKILPVGTWKPNIKVSLLDDAGDVVEEADWLKVNSGDSTAIFLENPDDSEGLGYSWQGFQNAVHVKIEEITARGNYVIAHGQFRNLVQGMSSYYVDEAFPNNGSRILHYFVEGVNWHWFNTADKTNFKVTEDAHFDSEELEQGVLTETSIRKTFKVMMIPRFWWAGVRFSTDLINDTIYGVFRLPPKDFVMPKPRKAGNWQRSHGYQFTSDVVQIIDVSDPDVWVQRAGRLDDANAHTEIVLPGDDDDNNGFWIFHLYGNTSPINYYCYEQAGSPSIDYFQYRSTEAWGSCHTDYNYPYVGGDSFCSWEKWPDDTVRCDISTYPVQNYLVGSIPQYYVHGGWWGSTPDAKIPVMVSTIDRSPSSDPYYFPSTYDPEHGVYIELIATRTYKYYDPTDTDTYIEEETAKIVDLQDHFLGASFCDRAGEVPDSFMFGCCEAREGDLVGVLVDENEKFFFIWRKTDERLAYQGPGIGEDFVISGQHARYDDLVVGSLFTDVDQFRIGFYSRGEQGCPCPEIFNTLPNVYGYDVINHLGHIEFEEGKSLTPTADSGFVPRIQKFGSWVEFTSNWAEQGIIHHGVSLGPGVRPLYYDQRATLKSFERRLQEFNHSG